MATAIEELLGLLQAATGESTGSLHSKLGHWRQRVSESLGNVIALVEVIQEQQSHPPQAAPKPFGQSEMTSTGDGQALGLGTNVLFDGPGFGDIPYSPLTGVFSLEANKRYRLTAHFGLGGYSGETVNVLIEWVDAVTNAVLHDGHGALCTPGSNTNSINVQPTADTFHATSIAQGVKCRVTSTLGTATALPGDCSALVEEL